MLRQARRRDLACHRGDLPFWRAVEGPVTTVKPLLTPFLIRDPAVGAVQAVGALRGPLRLPPGVPGTDFWLPGTV